MFIDEEIVYSLKMRVTPSCQLACLTPWACGEPGEDFLKGLFWFCSKINYTFFVPPPMKRQKSQLRIARPLLDIPTQYIVTWKKSARGLSINTSQTLVEQEKHTHILNWSHPASPSQPKRLWHKTKKNQNGTIISLFKQLYQLAKSSYSIIRWINTRNHTITNFLQQP